MEESAYRHAPTAFADREDAGRQLAERLLHYADQDPIVIALPRGGVPVAHEIAIALDAPLDVFAVRKLGAPHQPEFGIGAVAEDGTAVINWSVADALGLDAKAISAIRAQEEAELRRRVSLYRKDRAPLELAERTVIVVDDGVATGGTDAAALRAIRRQGPRRLILAVPVISPEVARHLAEDADEVISLISPRWLDGVGRWFRDFSQVPDEEVVALLGNGRGRDQAAPMS